MNTTIVIAVDAVWVVVVLGLFGKLGSRRAILIAVFGSFLILPREAAPLSLWGLLPIDKRVVTGLAVLLGLLIFDRRTLFRARPGLVDLPMIGFVLMPLVSLAFNDLGAYRVTIGQVWRAATEWGLPYLAGRLIFGDREGPRDLCKAVVVTGILSIPIYAFEMTFGPRHFLAGVFYGIEPSTTMVARLGGWRPEGFQTNGLEVATWIALASTVSTWLWLKRERAVRAIPGWVPPLALIATTVACRGIYGYLELAVGLLAAILSHFLRTRVLLVVLALIPPVYVGVRTSGVWDGHALVELAQPSGRADSVAYRLRAEDSYIKLIKDHNLVIGYGGTDSSIYDWFNKTALFIDGWWLHKLKWTGVIGLGVFLLALFLTPIGLGLALPAGKSGRASPGALAWGLALFLILHQLDSLQNQASLDMTPLIGGALASLFLARRTIRPDQPPLVDPARGTDATGRLALPITVVLLIVVEILGHLPKPAATVGPPPPPPVSGAAPSP